MKDDYGRIPECKPEELPEAFARRDQKATQRRLERHVRDLAHHWPGENSWDESDTHACASAMMRALLPTDSIERMHAAKAVMTYNMGLDCAMQAKGIAQRGGNNEPMLKLALKYFDSSTRHLEALDKHRNKGVQTVQHVHIGAGGQAIVGNVDARKKLSGKEQRLKQAPPEIEHAPSVAFEMPAVAAAPVKPNQSEDGDDDA